MPQEHTIERAVLVGLNADCFSKEETASEASLEELEALLETAGGLCTAKILQNRHTPDARTLIGAGKAEEIRQLIQATEAGMAIFDNPLSPSQIRVLEELLGVAVLDRSALILDIFAQRAKTKEGRLQVELAQYQYLLPRLTGMGISLSRQGGGIGTRGPGETQLETDRLHIRARIAKLEEELAQVRQVRAMRRRQRIKKFRPGGGHRGLHQRGQIHAAEPAHRSGHPRQQPPVRHAGHHHPAAGGKRTPYKSACRTP